MNRACVLSSIVLAFAAHIALPAAATERRTARQGSTDAALTRWLAGGWGGPEGRCDPYLDILYDPSGHYADPESEGLWRIQNGQLVLTVTRVTTATANRMRTLSRPQIRRVHLSREGPNLMVQTAGGRTIRYTRCSADTRPWTG